MLTIIIIALNNYIINNAGPDIFTKYVGKPLNNTPLEKRICRGFFRGNVASSN